MLDLSIIIVNFNTQRITLDCIKSINEKTKGIEYEIILIDNASKDGSVNAISKLKEHNSKLNLKIIENKKNLGFGPGNNQGIRMAKGEFILLLNTDTLIHDNVLSEIVDWMRKNEKVGVATCALKNKDGSLQGTGGYFPTLFRVFAWMFFLEDIPLLDALIKPFHPVHGQSPFYKGTSQFKKPREQDWVTGAFLLTRRDVINKVGNFDEDYFMYTEEVDFCFRVKKAGWQIWYLPKWSITHLGGASSTAEFPIVSEYKGIKIFYSKHYPPWQHFLLRIFLKTGAFLRMIIFGVIKGKEAANVYAKAYQIA